MKNISTRTGTQPVEPAADTAAERIDSPRRKLLWASASLGALALTGCSGEPDEVTTGGNPPPSSGPTPPPASGPTPPPPASGPTPPPASGPTPPPPASGPTPPPPTASPPPPSVPVQPQTYNPPYALPTAAGQVVRIGANTPQDVAPPGWSSYFTEFSLFNSFGAGIVIPEFSPGGAYVFSNIGGHSHPDIAGAVVFDYTDARWKRLEHANGGDQWGVNENKSFSEAQSNGAPYWEIANTVNGNRAVPLPGHPYQFMAERPPAAGGGAKGSIIYVCRAAVGPSWDKQSGATHAFDLNSRVWTRVTNNLYPRPLQYEGSAVYDAARGRYWLLMIGQHNYQSVPYLRVSDWTWQNSGSYSGYPDARVGVGCRMNMYQGSLLIQGEGRTLWVFNPDNAAAGFQQIAMSGAALPSSAVFRMNRMAYYAPADAWYYAHSNAGSPGSTLYRVKVNLANRTAVVSTVSLSQPLPSVGDYPNDQSDAYHMLHYVPAIQRLAWIHSATGYVYLIKPE